LAPTPRLGVHAGSAILSYGFRPFFLAGACYAAAAMLVWMLVLSGELTLPTHFTPRDWHVHEMLFGYVAAIVTGFLLTAIPNWTGRLPLQGWPLLGLVIAWAAGRAAVMFSARIGWIGAAVIDSTFLLLVAAACLREIIAGRNWQNLKVLLPVSLLAGANLGSHIEAGVRGTSDYAVRAGLIAVMMLIMLIGGRVVPSFTRNWLVRENPGRMPAPFGRFDQMTIAASAAALLLWLAWPDGTATAFGLAAAGILQTLRLARWAGERTTADRLVLVLHVAYAFVPIGFLLAALSACGLVGTNAGIHAWTAGAIGLMTLAIMTRATLGHTGRPLVASAATQWLYAAMLAATLCRIGSALQPAWTEILLAAAGAFWIAAFLGYVLVFGPMLLQPRA